ncbi:MAG TPA: chorismate synthase [Terriglobales bacterium]|nr:chorismate synthase [Terriglobales bacterium]
MLRYFTSGESHGEALIAILSGLPAGLAVDQAFVDRELWRRQQGYGRGGRMKIESDKAHFLSGIRHGKTIGSPIAVLLQNRDWQNWKDSLPVESGDPEKHKRVASPRPGHADLAGALKYDFDEARYVLERASARESAARVAIGAMAKLLLRELGIEVLSHVIAVGAVSIVEREIAWEEIEPLSHKSEVLLSCADAETERRMKEEVDKVLRTGDSVGGVFEVVAHNVPPGLGSYVQWDERLDAMLAAAVMSLQAVKAVEIGVGVHAAYSPGSAVHDEIGYQHDSGFSGFTRTRNNAGGIEGGVSNGQEIRVRGYLKPISTLRRPLQSVDFATREPVKAAYERSDVCVVPAAGVAAEAMVALTLARCALDKFGGDSLRETRRNFAGYLEQLKNY